MPVLPDAQAVQDLFKHHFGFRSTHVTRAPAALEVLGSYAADNEGLALMAAVDRYAYVASSPRTDGKIELIDADRAPEVFWISEPKSNPASPWANALKAVLRELRRRKVHFSGFNAAIHSEIPAGLRLGEEAAAAVAAALMVRTLFPFSLSDSGSTVPPKRDELGHLPPVPAAERLHFARVCAAALTATGRGTGGFPLCLTSLLGKKWNLLGLDCRFNSVNQTPFLGTALIVCDSGNRSAEAGVAMAEMRDHCLSAARVLRAKALRSVEPRALRAAQDKLEPRDFACADFVVGEVQRVAAAERALQDEDHRQFGNFVSLSHENLRDGLSASSPELDLLVSLARAHPGCLGARSFGGGYGGATVSIVAYHAAEPFIAHMAKAYEARTGRKLVPMVCQIVDGAG
jgi:galactokinase